jgi:hypothetical protein
MTRLSPFLAWVASLPDEALPSPARPVLAALAAHADGGREDPTHEDIGKLSGHAPRSVERHVATLSRPESGVALVEVENVRTAEGWPRNRYRLLAPLNIVEAAETYRLAVHIARDGEVGGVAALAASRHIGGRPAAKMDSLPPNWREASRQNGEPAANMAGGEYEEQARARARHFPSLHPSFSDFAWPSEDIAAKAERVLVACGPGLRPIEADPERMLGSLAQLLTGEWAKLDLGRDVIPVVKETTKRPRRNPLADFKLPARDVAAKVGRRMLGGQGSSSGGGARGAGGFASNGVSVGSAVDDPQRQRAKRIDGWRRIIAMIEDGQRPEWTLNADERVAARADVEAAFGVALERYRAELRALEAEDGDGGR